MKTRGGGWRRRRSRRGNLTWIAFFPGVGHHVTRVYLVLPIARWGKYCYVFWKTSCLKLQRVEICFNSCRLKIWTNTIEKVQGKGPDGEVTLLPSCSLFLRSPSGKEYISSPSTCIPPPFKTLPSLGMMTNGQHLASAWELKPKSQPAFSYTIRKYLSNTRAILKTQSHKNPTQRNKQSLKMEGRVSMDSCPMHLTFPLGSPNHLGFKRGESRKLTH